MFVMLILSTNNVVQGGDVRLALFSTSLSLQYVEAIFYKRSLVVHTHLAPSPSF